MNKFRLIQRLCQEQEKPILTKEPTVAFIEGKALGRYEFAQELLKEVYPELLK